MPEQVIVVKVHRDAAGDTIPYDKLYFFNRENRDLIPKIFGYALVLPVEEKLISSLLPLTPKTISHYKQRRDDAALNVDTLLDGRVDSKSTREEWWETNVLEKYDFSNRVAVVPVLTRKARNKIHPVYLTSQKWYTRQQTKTAKYRHSRAPAATINQSISELAYLATPEPPPDDKVSPLCSICPRSLSHLQGKCFPGENVCYHALDFNKIGIELPAASDSGETA